MNDDEIICPECEYINDIDDEECQKCKRSLLKKENIK